MNAAATANPYLKPAGALHKALVRFRDLHPDITAQQILFLLAIATSPGITQRELYQWVGSNDSVASRTISLLTDYGNRHTPGLDLVRMEEDPNDRRRKTLELTAKGRRLMDDVTADLR